MGDVDQGPGRLRGERTALGFRRVGDGPWLPHPGNRHRDERKLDPYEAARQAGAGCHRFRGVPGRLSEVVGGYGRRPRLCSVGDNRGVTVASSVSRRRQHLFLLRELVVRNVRSRYAGSALGLAWSVLNPLWQLLLFTFVFFRVLELSLDGEQTQNFAVFLFCGLLPWMAVHEGVSRSASALTDNADLVKKMRLPGELLVASLVIGALLNASIGAVAFVVVLAAIGELSVASLPLMLVAVPLQAALTFGLGLGLAAANAYFRDTAQAAGLVLNAWFFVTPIFYSVHGVPAQYLRFLEWNPLTGLVYLYRAAFLGGGIPVSLTPLLAATIAAVVFGGAVFARLKHGLADEI
ncbi:MAG: ABC transporter permease [Holophagales bacterium]|nr:ABC transporter permease [Holophagales bacterium]MYD23421.1 ABC transporter permease [Holophagales bacterium]MYI33596.1 ABC transporter permease [Holophagales bacterium]